MKTIFKFNVHAQDETLFMPRGAKIISVQVQYGDIAIWAIVDRGNHLVKRRIKVYGTGHDITDDHGEYIGTVQMEDGMLVWHVFDEGEVK